MRRKIISFVLMLAMLSTLIVLPTTASAATYGDYTYTISDGEVTITDFDTSVSGEITIPSEIAGYPVISIANWAFSYCHHLTRITIPNSVTSIGDNAFYGCSELYKITIPESVKNIGDYTFYNCSSLTSIKIPEQRDKYRHSCIFYLHQPNEY